MADHVVAEVGELGPGEHLVVELEGREVGVFNVDGAYRAYTNWCAHQSGPVCEGRKSGFMAANFDRDTLETTVSWGREGEVIACPWHGWEFDLLSGECYSRTGVQLIDHDVGVRDGEVVVTL